MPVVAEVRDLPLRVHGRPRPKVVVDPEERRRDHHPRLLERRGAVHHLRAAGAIGPSEPAVVGGAHQEDPGIDLGDGEVALDRRGGRRDDAARRRGRGGPVRRGRRGLRCHRAVLQGLLRGRRGGDRREHLLGRGRAQAAGRGRGGGEEEARRRELATAAAAAARGRSSRSHFFFFDLLSLLDLPDTLRQKSSRGRRKRRKRACVEREGREGGKKRVGEVGRVGFFFLCSPATSCRKGRREKDACPMGALLPSKKLPACARSLSPARNACSLPLKALRAHFLSLVVRKSKRRGHGGGESLRRCLQTRERKKGAEANRRRKKASERKRQRERKSCFSLPSRAASSRTRPSYRQSNHPGRKLRVS